ncbi:hypothetical protein EJ02DRAFT_426277 [Clathrospora elynae]|uniref:Uncharacterized protein n=1 Tax=Clathrospora elynae TaxID=706981 RepID=A0A6A5SD51_9PLEO|nr:hypothetical protein EJ02DRAFT_426277 [Clathrospora elynae]
MDYYKCSIEDLHRETRRRGRSLLGTIDQLSESLKRDDDARGSDATTVASLELGPFVPREIHLSRTAEFGETVPAGRLVNERIVYWTMNTFFPSIQIFFESGRSVTIDGSRLPDATIGLDSSLRFKLTDCTHEEDGRVVHSILPEKYPSSGTGLTVREAVIAQRTSIALKSVQSTSHLSRPTTTTTIETEIHTVVGLRLKGMTKMAYIWAKVETPSWGENKTWGDVRIAGLRYDMPIPSTCLPDRPTKPGSQTTVVIKDSLIKRR